MQTYAMLRRGGWRTGEELEQAAARSRQVADVEMPEDIRWIRSYMRTEKDGLLGIYEASSPEKIREHASKADLPATEILPIADTVIVRPDPPPSIAAAATK